MSDAEDLSPPAVNSPVEESEPEAEAEAMQTDDGPAAEQEDLEGDDGMDDLFGDDDDEDVQADRPKKRRLDDEDLDSGDDIDRNDRMIDEEEPGTPTMEIPEEITTTDVELSRHHNLRGSDGEVYLLHQQNFTGIEPKAFNVKSFEPPRGLHNSSEAPGPQFSAAQTATSTIRWRRSPQDPGQLQSNARIIRWSDGSLTMQIASDPLEQYELPAVARAAPQTRPKKPTPISRPLRKGTQPPKISAKDNSHYYLCSVNEATGYARVTNHVTVSLAVRSTKTTTDENADDATLKLQEIMARNAANKQALHRSRKIDSLEDPLEAQRRAIKAEKELAKAERQRQAKLERDQARRAGVMGSAANYGRSAGGGLNLGSLEDDLGRPRSKAPRKRMMNRSRYSDEEDDFRRGRTREDEYDEEDDFIAPSDEEGDAEAYGEEEEEEELMDEDADAEGEADDDTGAQAGTEKETQDSAAARNKRRTVIDDDDDDEE